MFLLIFQLITVNDGIVKSLRNDTHTIRHWYN